MQSAAVSLIGQGTVNFANVGAGLANLRVINNYTREFIPPGNTFLVQLYYANGVVTDQNQLRSVTNAPIGFSAPGIFTGGTRYLSDITPSGGIATIQVRSWASILGGTWEQACLNWLNGPSDSTRVVGTSRLFQVDAADPTITPQPAPANLVGMEPIVMGPPICIPEPGVLAFVILFGLPIVLWRSQNRRSFSSSPKR